MSRNVFVTVGTTKFDKLIETITDDNVLRTLAHLGYDSITLQIGNGSYEPIEDTNIIRLNYYRFKSSIKKDIENADLVVSHAGAGSCLEVLHAQKPLIVVINEDLMGNHQLEIAKALSIRNYLRYSTCDNLLETFRRKEFETLKHYPDGDVMKFVTYLDKCIGFNFI